MIEEFSQISYNIEEEIYIFIGIDQNMLCEKRKDDNLIYVVLCTDKEYPKVCEFDEFVSAHCLGNLDTAINSLRDIPTCKSNQPVVIIFKNGNYYSKMYTQLDKIYLTKSNEVSMN